jgi:poly [ADP-ribose] polymerase
MSSVVSKQMFIKTSVKDNNNKFWEVTLFSNDDVKCRWGRVGSDGTSKMFPGAGQKKVNTKIKEKTRKGYKEMEMVDGPTAVTTKKVAGNRLRAVAKKQIKRGQCKVTDKLIDYLVDVNRHDIKMASGGKLTVDVISGLIKTDVGVAVTQDTLDRARDHLVIISTCISARDWSSDRFIDNLNEYLMCVPQNVGRTRGWEKKFLTTAHDIQKQGALIDSMESTLQAFSSKPIVASSKTKEEEVFNVELKLIDDSVEINRIKKLYQKTQQRRHSCHHLKVKRVYNVHIATMANAFEKHGSKLKPVWELWHGTRASNLLSILKGGLIIPPSNAAHVTGRMFGTGIYMSDQSTKALNYAYGYWGGNRDNNCFMFLCLAGMGKYHVPRGPTSRFPRGYDSVYAQGGRSGVLNNEMIVPKTSQVNLVRLVEFAA